MSLLTKLFNYQNKQFCEGVKVEIWLENWRPQNSRLGIWINLKVGMSLSQAYSYILCKLHVQPIKTAEVAFFHLHFFHWRHIQWFFSLIYTDSAFFLLKNKKKILEKGWKLRKLWAKNCQVSTILEQTLIINKRVFR